MTALLFLIPAALALGALGLLAFLWALRSNQFDDLDGEAERILMDDAPRRQPAALTSAAAPAQAAGRPKKNP